MSDTRDLKEGSRHIHALRLRAAITSALVIAAFKSVLPPEKSRSLKAIDYVKWNSFDIFVTLFFSKKNSIGEELYWYRYHSGCFFASSL